MADYVPYGSRCKCSKGSMENYLSTEKGHGVIFLGNPLMNANDHVVGVNITHFGDCSSRKLKSFKFPKKCEPLLPTPWEEVKKTYLIEGAPALTMDSVLTCYYGGIITLVPPPPPEEAVVGEEVSIESLQNELSDIIDKQFNVVMKIKNVGFYEPDEALKIIIDNNETIQKLSERYNVPATYIQSILFRELNCIDIRDVVADTLVKNAHVYNAQVEHWNSLSNIQKAFMRYPLPLPSNDDSSTGYSQIFSFVAIDAINNAVKDKIIKQEQLGLEIIEPLNRENEQHIEYIWKKLHSDQNFNIEMATLNILSCAKEKVDLCQYFRHKKLNFYEICLAKFSQC